MARMCLLCFIWSRARRNDEFHPLFIRSYKYIFNYSCGDNGIRGSREGVPVRGDILLTSTRWLFISLEKPKQSTWHVNGTNDIFEREEENSQESSFFIFGYYYYYYYILLLRLLCACVCLAVCACVRVSASVWRSWLALTCWVCRLRAHSTPRFLCCDICWECTVLAVIHLDDFIRSIAIHAVHLYIHFTYFSFILLMFAVAVAVAVLLWLCSIGISLWAPTPTTLHYTTGPGSQTE